MEPGKTKKWARRILTGVLISFAITITVPSFTAYAATCPTGFSSVGDKCEKGMTPGATCPTGFIKDAATTTNTKLVCVKKPAPALEAEKVKNAMAAILLIQKTLNKLLWPVLVMTGSLIDNSLLFDNGMEDHLRSIWIPVRNIINILFVIALVGIALYNVLGIGDDNSAYSIKAVLPKLIIGIIAVNFSFLGVKIFLDGVNVLTTSVFALPRQVNEELATVINSTGSDADRVKIEGICKWSEGRSSGDPIGGVELSKEQEARIYRQVGSEYYTGIDSSYTKEDILDNVNANADNQLTDAQKTEFEAKIKTRKDNLICNGLKLSPNGRAFLRQYGSQNAALAMAINMGKIVFYEQIPLSVDNIEKLVISNIFSLLLYLVYAASFVALFIVLMARMVVLWLALALSPVLVLGIAVPFVKEKIAGFNTIASEFVKNAIAPLIIALAMSIGWIMLQGIQAVRAPTGAIRFGEGIPVVGLETMQDLVVCFATVGIVWMGVFGAANQTIAKGVTGAIQGGLKKAGTWAVTTPLKHMPVGAVKMPDGTSRRSTFGEVMELGRETMQRASAPQRGLAKAFFGERETLYDLGRAKNDKQFFKALIDNETAGPEEIKAAITEVKKNNRKFYDKLLTADNGRYGKLLKIIDETKDKDILRTKIRELVAQGKLKYTGSTGAPAPTTTAAATAAAAAKKGELKLGEMKDSVKITGKDEKETEVRIEQNAKILLDSTRSDLLSGIKNKNKTQIKTAIKGMHVEVGRITTVGQLKDLINNPKTYKALETEFGGESGLKTAVEEAVKSAGSTLATETATPATPAKKPPVKPPN